MNTRLPLALVLAGLLAACAQEGNKPAVTVTMPEAKTVAYYKANQDERKAKLAECHDRAVNTLQDTTEAAECRAAGKAAQDAFLTVAATTGKAYKRF